MAKGSVKNTEAKETVVNETIVKTKTVDATEEKAAAKKPRKFAADELITCRSITFGELLLTGPKSHLLYSWSNYGDTTEVEYQDLQALKSTKSSYLYRPRFIIEDDELNEQWSKDFKDLYDGIIEVDVDDILALPINQFKARLKKAPRGVQQAIKDVAGEKIMNGSLDSIKKIKAIDEILGTDLMLYVN